MPSTELNRLPPPALCSATIRSTGQPYLVATRRAVVSNQLDRQRSILPAALDWERVRPEGPLISRSRFQDGQIAAGDELASLPISVVQVLAVPAVPAPVLASVQSSAAPVSFDTVLWVTELPEVPVSR